MEVTTARPANEATALASASVQSSDRFNERRTRENHSDVKSQVVYFSPVVKIDKDTQTAVIQYRDSQTGDVKNEYPSSKQLKSYADASELDNPPVKAEPQANTQTASSLPVESKPVASKPEAAPAKPQPAPTPDNEKVDETA